MTGISKKTVRKRKPRPREKKTEKDKELSRPTKWIGIPQCIDGYEGFVYLVTNKLTGRMYVGRKYFTSKTRVKVKGSLRKKRKTSESNWRHYKTSCQELKDDISNLGLDSFEFRILHLCRTRAETNYLEVKEQFARDVLNSKLSSGEDAYYNGNIMSRYFKPKDSGPEYDKKCESISKSLKEGYKNGSIVHGMKGKEHPNKGKKLPQCGHNKQKGKVWYTDGKNNLSIGPGEFIPAGYLRGLTKKSIPLEKRTTYIEWERNRPVCRSCGGPLPYEKRKSDTCSQECAFSLISSLATGRAVGKNNPSFKHYYRTPYGVFETAKQAAEEEGCSDATIRNRCMSADKFSPKHGKTWREMGYWTQDTEEWLDE